MNDFEIEQNQEHVPVKQQLAILAVIMLLIFGSGYIPKLINWVEGNRDTTTATVPSAIVESITEQTTPVNYFEDVTISADSAYVWDVSEQRVLYKKNPDRQLPLASITKLMTALLAYEIIDSDHTVAITDEAILQDGASGLLGGETFTLSELLDLTLISSSNDGAYAIAAATGGLLADEDESSPASIFVEAMNIRASELGLTQTYFKNPTGLDISETEGGSYGSARDVTFLMEHILTRYPEILEATKKETVTVQNTAGTLHDADNTNPFVEEISGLIGSKTGYTDLAGGNLAVAFDAAFNRPIIVVVLGSTRSARFDDVLNLADRARNTVLK